LSYLPLQTCRIAMCRPSCAARQAYNHSGYHQTHITSRRPFPFLSPLSPPPHPSKFLTARSPPPCLFCFLKAWEHSLSDSEHKSVAATFISQLQDLEQHCPNANKLLQVLPFFKFDPENKSERLLNLRQLPSSSW
jgi:hypothetical protein